METHVILTKTSELHDYESFCYPPVERAGEYYLRLDFRAWYKKRGPALVCYFTVLKNRTGISLFAWRKMDISKNYSPKKSPVDFRLVKDGTYWHCLVEPTRTGKMKWTYAFEMTESEAREYMKPFRDQLIH